LYLHRGPTGEFGRGLIPVTLKDECKRALETEHLSMREFLEGNLEVGLLYWGP
jgi:hypothetical protein